MKIKLLILCLLTLIASSQIQAQETQTLTLKEAIDLALTNSDRAQIADTKVAVAKAEYQSLKNLQYPDVSVAAQYQRIIQPDIDIKIPTGSSDGDDEESGSTSIPDVHQVVLAQASVVQPLFTGFKLKNTVKAGESTYQAEVYNQKNEIEQLALQTIQDYINLYKARQTVTLLEENLKKSEQRVKDFTDKEANGIVARNDLLKAQLQQASDELTLEEARKNENILNYTLGLTLKLPENTYIETVDSDFGKVTLSNQGGAFERYDFQSLEFQKQAAEHQIKVAKSAYYPSLSIMAGYVTLDLQNLVSIQNAMNFGVGFSYNLAGIFKAKSEISAAQNRARELELTLSEVSDQILVEVQNAKLNYELAVKKQQVYIKSEEQATENYRIVKDKYDNDLVDINDLLQADVDQLQAKINLAYANADISQKYYELLTAKGELTNQFKN